MTQKLPEAGWYLAVDQSAAGISPSAGGREGGRERERGERERGEGGWGVMAVPPRLLSTTHQFDQDLQLPASLKLRLLNRETALGLNPYPQPVPTSPSYLS